MTRTNLTDAQAAEFGRAVIEIMDGEEWSSDTTEAIANLLEHRYGFEFAEPGAYMCDKCHEEAVNFWPNLTTPVQMCASCTHNARRSGWEPGQ